MAAPRSTRRFGSAQRIHGLVLACDRDLPGIPSASGAQADVELCIEHALPAPSPQARTLYRSAGGPDGVPSVQISSDGDARICFRYRDGTAFDVRVNELPVTIFAVIAPSQTLEDMAAYLYGPVLGSVLRSAGRLALHSSAVAMDGRVALFAGSRGAGKSTIAAALAARGHDVLSDDLTAITRNDGVHMAHRSFDHVRVWESSEPLLFGKSGVLSRITPGWEKRRFPLPERNDAAASVRINAIYLLDAAERTDLAMPFSDVHGVDALLALATVTYCNYLLNERSRATELQQLSALLADVPLMALPLHVARAMPLSQLCDAIERDMTTRSHAGGPAH